MKGIGDTTLKVCCEGERPYKIVGLLESKEFFMFVYLLLRAKKTTNFLACLGFVQDI